MQRPIKIIEVLKLQWSFGCLKSQPFQMTCSNLPMLAEFCIISGTCACQTTEDSSEENRRGKEIQKKMLYAVEVTSQVDVNFLPILKN